MRKSPFFALIKRELFSYLLNPAMYISSIVFLVSSTLYFFYTNRFFVEGLGSTDMKIFFSFMPYISILCIPAFTMGLWAHEEGVSDALPVSSTMLVCAKWLASIIIFSLTVFISLAIPICASFFGTVELPLVLTGTIGILLFAFALCAFGQLAALVFRNQSTAFFVTALLLALFNMSHIIPLTIYLPNWLSTLCNFVSFAWHFDSSGKGIFDTRDLFFYLISTAIFLLISIYVYEKRKYSSTPNIIEKKRLKTQYIGLIFVNLMLLWNSQVFYIRFDITENQRFTLSDFSKKLTDTLDTTLSISYYVSPELQDIYPQVRDVQDFLYSYANYSDTISVRIVDPNKNNMETALKTMGVIAQNIPRIEQNTTSIITVYSALVLEYLGNTEIIPFIFDTNSLEFDIAGRIQSLTGQLLRSAFVLVGNGLSYTEDYPYVQPWLESAGFTVLELQPNDILNTTRLDTRTPLIILGSSNLQPYHTAAIDSFIEGGGSVFFSVSPIDITIYTDLRASINDNFLIEQTEGTVIADNVIGLLERYGIQIQGSLIHDVSSLFVQTVQYPFFIDVKSGQINENNPLHAGFSGLSLFWPSPIRIVPVDNYTVQKLAFTSPQSWLQKPNTILWEQGESPFITDPSFTDNLVPDTKNLQSYTIATALHVKKENPPSFSRLITVSDQYFLSRMVEHTNNTRNFDFLVDALLWLQDEDDLLAIRSKTHTDYTLGKIKDAQTLAYAEKSTMTTLFLLFAFLCFLPYGFVRILRQRFKSVYNRGKK